MNVLNDKVLASITTTATSEHISESGKTLDRVFLIDVRSSVSAIPDNALPKQSSYALFGTAMVKALVTVCADHIAPKTLANKKAMVKLACVEAIENRALALCAQVRLTKATTKAQVKSAEKAVIKAAKTLETMGTSLDTASQKGRAIVDRKTTTITGFQKPKAASKASESRKANPVKGATDSDKAKRTADKELILQAIDNVVDIHAKGDNATSRQRENALGGLSSVALLIVSYLPEDMRTL